jgi:hypothetical protein
MTDLHSHAGAANDSVSHEESDIDIGGIFKFMLGLTIAAAAVHVVIWFMFVWFQAAAAGADVPNSLRVGEDVRIPPEPRLQVDPRQDLSTYREREAALLDGYRWVDKNAGVVRIPIDEAMKRLIERGVPTRPVQESGQGK